MAWRRKWDVFTVINTFFLLALVFWTLYPFLYMVNISLSSELYVLKNDVWFWPKGFTTQWYEIVLSDARILNAYKNTVLYVVLGTIAKLIFTSAAAYALSKRYMLFRKQAMLFILGTMLIGGGMIPTYLVVKSLGLLNTIWVMFIPSLISTYNIIVFRTFFEGLPEELDDAGRIDGLSEVGLFFRIVIPLSKPVYAALGLFVAVGIWNDFYTPFLYIRNPSLWPLQVILQDLIISGSLAVQAAAQAASGGVLPGGEQGNIVVESLKFATIIVSTLPILLLYPFLQKYFVKGVMIGSVKG